MIKKIPLNLYYFMLGFALVMGFAGGFLPAAKASRLAIVDALRAA